MTKQIEALKLARSALNCTQEYQKGYAFAVNAAYAIDEALARPDHIPDAGKMMQPEQEPVAFMEAKADNECADAYADGWNACVNAHKNSTPPKRPWVGLTDEEKSLDGAPVRYGIEEAGSWASGAEWAEAKLKEKNT